MQDSIAKEITLKDPLMRQPINITYSLTDNLESRDASASKKDLAETRK